MRMLSCVGASVAICMLFAGGMPVLAADLTPAEATEVLTKKELVRKGTTWILSDEVKLAENLTALPTLEKKARDASLKFEDLIKGNKVGMPQMKKLRDEYEQIQKLLKAPNLTPQQQSNLAVEHDKRVMAIQQLEKTTINLRMNPLNPAFIVASQELSTARTELTNAVLQIQKAVPTLEDKYQALKEDAEVKTALAALGSGAKLGPLKPYAKELTKIATAEKMVFGDVLPLYRIGNNIVYDAFVDDKVLPLGYRTTSESAIMQVDVLESVGIKIPADAPTVTLTVDGAQYPCRLAKIPKIRVGRYELENVDVLVTPAAAKFLGPWLGTKSYAQYEVHEEIDECKFTIRPLNATSGDKKPVALTPARPLVKPVKP